MSTKFELTRRDLLLSLPALAVARKAFAQAGAPTLRVARAEPHDAQRVGSRSARWTSIRASSACPSRRGRARRSSCASARGRPSSRRRRPAARRASLIYCVAVENFNVDQVVKALAAHGVTKAEGEGGGLAGGPMKVRVRMRGPEAGGAREGTPEILLRRSGRHHLQLQDPKYAGGAGKLGDV